MPPLGPKHKKLFPQFAPPETWRTRNYYVMLDRKGGPQVVRHEEFPKEWKEIRSRILARDNGMCRYCGFDSFKWQIVHHIDGNPQNNNPRNLETVCPMCNAILHAGLHCTVRKTVDLYRKSRYGQADVVRRTRVMRAHGYSDEDIIRVLGLREHVLFRSELAYLRRLTGFVSSRRPESEDFMSKGIEFGYEEVRKRFVLRRG